MPYLHGAYAQNLPSGITVPAKSGTLHVTFGTAPIHQLMDYTGNIATPVVLDSDSLATTKMGYTDNWKDFSLSEPHYLHFRSAEPVGPVVFVNILDPVKHRKKVKTTISVLFTNGKGELVNDKAILSTIAITGKTLGTDFTAAYDATGTKVIMIDPTGAMSGPISVDFFEVDLSLVTEADMAATIKATTGLVYETANLVPTILTAPGWSDKKAVNDALKNAAQAINGHWNAFVLNDIDVMQTTTGTAAMAKQLAELRTTAIEKTYWPMATDGRRYFHGSALAATKSQIVDGQNGGAPYETTSNKSVAVSGLVVGDGSGGYLPIKLDQLEGNKLNAVGISTMVFWAGGYRLWGPHTGKYKYGSSNVAEEIFDSTVRMTQYLGNSFQLQFGDEVDKPMPRSRIDSILNSFQEFLDNLKNRGALLFGEITFLPTGNVTTDMIAGEFYFDTGYTTTPPGRALVNRFRYTAAGLETLVGGDQLL